MSFWSNGTDGSASLFGDAREIISVMKSKTKAQLIAELKVVQARVAGLERQVVEVKHAAEAARALAQLSRELAGTLDLAQSTERVVRTVARLFGLRHSLLFRLDPASGSLICVAAADGRSREKWIGWTLPAGTGLAGLAIMEGRPITPQEVANLATLPSFEVVRAQALGAITSPLYTIVGLFTAPLRDLVGLIDARIEQLGGVEPACRRARGRRSSHRTRLGRTSISRLPAVSGDGRCVHEDYAGTGSASWRSSSSSSSMMPRVFDGSTLIPGPIVVVSVICRM